MQEPACMNTREFCCFGVLRRLWQNLNATMSPRLWFAIMVGGMKDGVVGAVGEIEVSLVRCQCSTYLAV